VDVYKALAALIVAVLGAFGFPLGVYLWQQGDARRKAIHEAKTGPPYTTPDGRPWPCLEYIPHGGPLPVTYTPCGAPVHLAVSLPGDRHVTHAFVAATEDMPAHWVEIEVTPYEPHSTEGNDPTLDQSIPTCTW
jgi:hypothetical protein